MISEHGNPLNTVAQDDINENDQNFKTPSSTLMEKKRSRGHSHSFRDASQMNMRGIFLHVLADALGSVVVVISALVIWKTDWDSKFYLDPALSLVLVVLILKSVWPLLLESALILLQTVPTHIQVDAIQRRLLDKVDGVLAVHEFHVWQLTGDRIIASAHIRCRNLSEYMKLAEKVKEFFHNEGIHSTTIQPEFLEINEMPKGTSQTSSDSKKNGGCVLDCPKSEDQTCALNTCCGPQGSERPSKETPYLCRQRCGSVASFNQIQQELHGEMESGHLLSINASRSYPKLNSSPQSYPKLNNKESRV
ncbi:Cobalt uptake protein COT1, putative [Pediculus humanus corporis]|uniref:Cobalt uptake protein COT1, putative n=1 Tax=Pediculus humanus subsp. corporis TaxID=121224 RepID=E0VV21_PEDHC|nr:Cobalt uptake protein COT1, putative [Pediculus humanus corporis]EEB17227.1 Cobalt uptake protein COT1, putative [Pediculus humanus corporis]